MPLTPLSRQRNAVTATTFSVQRPFFFQLNAVNAAIFPVKCRQRRFFRLNPVNAAVLPVNRHCRRFFPVKWLNAVNAFISTKKRRSPRCFPC